MEVRPQELKCVREICVVPTGLAQFHCFSQRFRAGLTYSARFAGWSVVVRDIRLPE